MTKKEMFAVIANAMADNAEVVEFCNHEIELLSRKRSKSNKPTPKQIENEGIKERIVAVLGESEAPMTIKEIIESLGEKLTSQRVSALLTQLIKAEIVVKTYEKKVTIPAGGSIDYSELLDLKELTQDNDYTVAVEFGVFSVSKAATGEVILLFSDAYLLNDGTPTAIQTVPAAVGKSSAVYDLRGRRVSGEPRKGIYIIDGKKRVLK